MFLTVRESVKSRFTAEQLASFEEVHESDFLDESLFKTAESLMLRHAIKPEDLSIATNDEFALISAASLREQLGLKGAKVCEVELFMDKIKMKERVQQGGVNIPKHLLFKPDDYKANKEGYLDNIIERLGGNHIFSKPIDSVGSQGVAEIKTREELSEWCELHQEDENYELDEFLTGDFFI